MKTVKRAIGEAFLKATGWKAVGERPTAEKYVLIAAPHTTNWDLPYTVALGWVFDLHFQWAGKHTLFEPPFGPFMRWLGGIPIVRHTRGNRVEQLAALFDEYEHLALVMPAEGTRSRTEYWKSGFYHIACKAQVPIVCGFLDFGRKEGGFGPAVLPTGDIVADMDRIRAFYADKTGKYPENFGPVRLKEEDAAAEDQAEAA